MSRKEIKMPYGFCSYMVRPCPCPDDPACTIDRCYLSCSYFVKKGEKDAIEEIDVDGERRVYFKTAKISEPGDKENGNEHNNSSGQGLLGGGAGW